MGETNQRIDWKRWRRLASLAAGISVALAAGAYALLWAEDSLPWRMIWKARLALLIAAEAAYVSALVCALGGTVVLGMMLHRARRARVSRPRVARGLLLCGSLLLAIGLSEGGAAVWNWHVRKSSAVPAGGLRAGRRTERLIRFPSVQETIELPTEFPDEKLPGEVRLLVVGESSAQGVPYEPAVSLGALVIWQLEQLNPNRPFRLQIIAGSGETLETEHRWLAKVTTRPDVIIIYCGHNEFSARFPWSRNIDYYLDADPPPFWTIALKRAERLSPVCGLIGQVADKCRVAIPPEPGEGRALVDTPAYTPAEYATLLFDFRRRLELMVSYAERIGALPILIAPPGNDSGFEPNRSFLPPRTTRSERRAFEQEFRAARRIEASDPAGSVARYRTLLAQQPRFAEAHYRLARLLERTGAWEEVYQHDLAARDCDGLPMRSPSAFQAVYRAVAARHDCIFIDGQTYFHAVGRHGLLDESLFHDGMHPSLRGQIALAQAVLQGLCARGAFGWPAGVAAPLIDPAQCAANFGLDPQFWRKIALWGIMFYELTGPMRYDPSQRLAKREAFAAAATRIDAGEAPERVGLPNLGVPPAVPFVPGAATITRLRPPPHAAGRQQAAADSATQPP